MAAFSDSIILLVVTGHLKKLRSISTTPTLLERQVVAFDFLKERQHRGRR